MTTFFGSRTSFAPIKEIAVEENKWLRRH